MKKVKLISLISIACAGIFVAGSIPLYAWTSYTNYLNGIANNGKTDSNNTQASSSNNSENQNKELILEKITAKLKDGLGYYDNGRAIPKFDDFEVYAHYKKGEEEIEERLYDDQVEMEVPSDFVEDGGIIKFTYKDKTFDFDVVLAPVAISKLKVTENPYIIYYKEGEKLDIQGIKVEGINNDGTPCDVNISDVVAGENPLKVGDSEGAVSLRNNKDIKGIFPITVVKEEEYNEGDILSYDVDEGNLLLKDGEKLSNSDSSSLKIVARYSSGNKRLMSEDKITIEDDSKTVSFGSDLETKIKVENEKSVDELFVKVKTAKELNADDPSLTLNGFKKESAPVYVVDENSSIAESPKTENVLISGAAEENRSIAFKFNSASFTTADVSIDLASSYEKEGDSYVSKAIALNKAINLKVNGLSKTIDSETTAKQVSSSDETKVKNAYQKIFLRNVNIVEGENKVEIVLLSDYAEEVSIRSINLTSLGEVPEYTFPSYLEGHELAKKDKMADAQFYSIKNYSFFKDDSGDLKIPYSSFIDNGYLYSFLGAYEGKKAALVKFDFSTMKEVKSNLVIPEHKADWGSLGSIVDLGDDKLGLVRADVAGSEVQEVTIYSKNTLKETGKISLQFPWQLVVKGLTFNKTLRKFAAYDGNTTWLLDENGNVLKENFIGKFQSWGNLTKHEGITDLSGNDDYIIVIAQYGESEEPGNKQNYDFRTLVYDWEGNEVYHTPEGQKYKFDYTNMPENDNWKYWNFGAGWESRAYQLILNGDETYLMCAKISNDGFFISSAAFNPNFAKHFDSATLGGYIGKASNEGKNPSYTSKLLNSEGYKIKVPYKGENKEGIIDSTVTLNGNVYATVSINGGSQAAMVAQLEVSATGVTIKEQSKVFELITQDKQDPEWVKATTIFTKDGKLGVFNNRNATITFFDADTLNVIQGEDLTVKGTDAPAIYGTYSDVYKKYVFFDGNKFYFADEDGNLTGKTFGNKQPDKDTSVDGTVLNMQLTTDGNYIYMLYTQDGLYNAKIRAFDWDGNEVGLATVPLNGKVDGAGEFKKFNVKNIFFLKGKLYLEVFAHDGKGNFTYEVSYDQSIFANA